MISSEITRDQIGNRILGVMIAWEPGQVIWTPENLWCRLIRITLEQVRIALDWLLKRGCVERIGQYKWAITATGRETYEAARLTNSKDVVDTTKFRTEALTGMDENGEQTTLTSVVLPAHDKIVKPVEINTIKMCDLNQNIEKIAQQIGKTVQETREAIQDDLIAVCNGCGRLSLFHAHRSQRDGVRRQSLCIECRKIRRRSPKT